MTRLTGRVLSAVAAMSAVVCLMPMTARAGIWENIPYGLGYAGFNIEGQHNYLSGGNDYRISKFFTSELSGNPLDFGTWELTLGGPISIDVSTGGRLIDEIEIHFQTATSSAGVPQPLSYDLACDVCSQASQISGSILIDGDLTINEFGCYDFHLEYSSRQSVEQNGPFDDGDITNDFDIGPIDISGNIYADILALIFDPIFERMEVENPFASFSGQLQLEKAIERISAEQAKQALLAEDLLLDTGSPLTFQPDVVGLTPAGEMAMEDIFSVESGTAAPRGVVPEPSTVLFIILGAPLIGSKRLRDRIFGW